MYKNKTILYLFLFIFISIFFTSCYDFNICINVKEDGSNTVNMSFLLREDGILLLSNMENFKGENLVSIENKIDNIFLKNGFLRDKSNTKGYKYIKSEEFSSYEELKESLINLKIKDRRIFSNIELEDRDNSILFYISMNDSLIREDKLFTLNPSFYLDFTMPYEITISNGGEIDEGNKIRFNLLNNDNFYVVSNRPGYKLGTTHINILMENEDKGYIEWIIEEKIGEEKDNIEIKNLAISWGFNEKIEEKEENTLIYNKIMPFTNIQELKDLLLNISLKGDPENKDYIFDNVDIIKNDENFIFSGITNRLYHKEPIIINIAMPYEIIESRGGYLFNNKTLSCSIKKLNNNELIAKTEIPDNSFPTVYLVIIWGVSIIVFLLIIIFIINIIEKNIKNKKENKEKETKTIEFPEIDKDNSEIED